MEASQEPPVGNRQQAALNTAKSSAPFEEADKPFVDLGTMVHRALETRDGPSAMRAANRVRECQFLELHQRSAQRAMLATSDLALRQLHAGKFTESMVKANQCPALGGDLMGLQRRLLAIATQKGEIGAAAALLAIEGSGSPAMFGQIAMDARAGDVESLVQLISRSTQATGQARELHQALTQALLAARQDPELATLAKAYLDVATGWAAARQSSDADSASDLARSIAARPPEAVAREAELVLGNIRRRHAGR
ncbi:hypothetical protein [Pelomonas sp. SE-A7]|uniref:hypothetical protein n=1 Tax=Pelomonas sp. SE-A7 TaxID=3054953 RepID=UPI00259CB2A2|nr:hypothetical protein [Pelomonas sp. SE-A7]MDM4767125.1 hypothetical protein [Pelomonas sp. SE-A7]